MSVKGNQNAATYKKEIILSYLQKFPKATTMAICRMIFFENPLDFTSLEGVRGMVRQYRCESKKN